MRYPINLPFEDPDFAISVMRNSLIFAAVQWTQNRSIASWFLYIISAHQNLQIGAFPLKKNSHSIDEPEGTYMM